ncbi:Uncharacterized protein BM_BM17692 [Brugia malayi]|uniref:Uncharacterized protein n=1 Tax=Brugia malayi TaxID=6279 RepID=A0A4E9FX20_BRUMA|nr:Uncharacterized protein BM_BM17692 [Brugia malayi]VIO97433.1 Uncharacterized protein BM_BM17692 [Brugia malayi]
MICIVLVTLLTLYIFGIEMVPATNCHFSRPNQISPSGWVDLIDKCKEESNDTICFSGYNPRVAYYHEAVGWWRVLHSENECFTKQYLRKKLACKSDQETPEEGCYRDKTHHKNFFLCWCTGSKCNTRQKITEIYKKNNTLFVIGGDCKPFEF